MSKELAAYGRFCASACASSRRALRLRFRAGGFSARDLQRGAGEIRAKHPRATRSQEPGEASAAASHFQNAPALDGRQIFAHQLVPRAFCVVAFRRRVENFLVPIVVFSREMLITARLPVFFST